MAGGSLADAERNAAYESAFTAGAGLINEINAGAANLPTAMADHSNASFGAMVKPGPNQCGAGH
jgi:hypothetical protein